MNNPKHKGLGLGSLSRCTRARRKTSRREKKKRLWTDYPRGVLIIEVIIDQYSPCRNKPRPMHYSNGNADGWGACEC